MAGVVRLVTVVDIDERNFPIPLAEDDLVGRVLHEDAVPAVAPPIERPVLDPDRNQGFTARHLAVLDDGRRMTLIDDRGWGGTGPSGIWRHTTAHEIEDEARMVVGPDDDDPRSVAAHWQSLTNILRRQGVPADADLLRGLSHDVELSAQIRRRLAGE